MISVVTFLRCLPALVLCAGAMSAAEESLPVDASPIRPFYALHARQEFGRFRTAPQHIASQKIALIESGATELLRRARLVGPQTARWAEAVLKERGIEGVRVLVGLLSLVRKHWSTAVERGCALALGHSAFRLRELRALIKEPVEQGQLEFMAEHPVIRLPNFV